MPFRKAERSLLNQALSWQVFRRIFSTHSHTSYYLLVFLKGSSDQLVSYDQHLISCTVQGCLTYIDSFFCNQVLNVNMKATLEIMRPHLKHVKHVKQSHCFMVSYHERYNITWLFASHVVLFITFIRWCGNSFQVFHFSLVMVRVQANCMPHALATHVYQWPFWSRPLGPFVKPF